MTAGSPASVDIGVQLYSVNAELGADLDTTLASLADIGYRTVESANFAAQLEPAVLRAALDRVGMRCASAHLPLPQLTGDLPGAIAEARSLGARYVVASAPWVEDGARFTGALAHHTSFEKAFAALMQGMTEADWRWNARQLNRAGAALVDAGLQLAYHNHGFEFRDLGGGTAYDLLLEATDPDLVSLELDCGWLVNAGQDPCVLLRRLRGRVRLLHLKDLKRPAADAAAFELDGVHCGGGIIDWSAILRAADTAGVEHCFVEQEPPFPVPALQELRASHRHLTAIGSNLAG